MVENFLITIIVPIYNVESFLAECLDSIIEQTYSNIEIILVDDGSTDRSGSIADEYAKKDTRISISHKNNLGVSSARNAGIELSKGDFICFVDSDDILEKDYVEYLLTLALENNSDIALTAKMFTSFGDLQMKKEEVKKVSGEEAAKMILHYFIPIGCYCKLFSRKLLDSGIRFIPEVYIGEGFNFNVDAFMNANQVTIGNRKIYHYRRTNTESAMTKFRVDKCEMALRAIEIIRDKLPKTKEFKESCDYAYWHTASNMYDWMILSNVEDKYPNLYNECYQWVRNYSWSAFRSVAPKSDKIRAFLQSINSRLVPNILKIRNRIFL